MASMRSQEAPRQVKKISINSYKTSGLAKFQSNFLLRRCTRCVEDLLPSQACSNGTRVGNHAHVCSQVYRDKILIPRRLSSKF